MICFLAKEKVEYLTGMHQGVIQSHHCRISCRIIQIDRVCHWYSANLSKNPISVTRSSFRRYRHSS